MFMFGSLGNFHEIPMDFLEMFDVIDDLWIKIKSQEAIQVDM